MTLIMLMIITLSAIFPISRRSFPGTSHIPSTSMCDCASCSRMQRMRTRVRTFEITATFSFACLHVEDQSMATIERNSADSNGRGITRTTLRSGNDRIQPAGRRSEAAGKLRQEAKSGEKACDRGENGIFCSFILHHPTYISHPSGFEVNHS